MMLYRDIVITAVVKEIVPILKEFTDEVLTEVYGQNWYEVYGRNILKNYKWFKHVERRIEVGIKPLEFMDIDSLFFLFYPYEHIKNGDHLEYKTYSGAMDVVGKYYHWSEEQIRAIRRIYTIRNGAVVSRYDQDDRAMDEMYRITGKQETDWLYELEALMQIIKPSFHLEAYRKMLAEAAMEEIYRRV